VNKPTKSQWDFGELFPTEQIRKVLSVSELTSQIRGLLEKQIGQIWVGGEITNLRIQSSGHMYFTLKDVGAQLSCVLFGRERVTHREQIADGQKVLLQGDVTVYETRGQYQLIVRAVELQGVGALQAAFEKLKQKLAAEGLFAAERKRPLPLYPQRIGLVTSPTGAAIRDVIHVIQRRNPGLEIILAPCRVQGDGAAREVAEAIQLLNELSTGSQTPSLPLDLILMWLPVRYLTQRFRWFRPSGMRSILPLPTLSRMSGRQLRASPPKSLRKASLPVANLLARPGCGCGNFFNGIGAEKWSRWNP